MKVFGLGARRAGTRSMAALAVAAMMGVALPQAAAGQDLAQMQVQITQLQEQVRQYSGQVEGLQFQLTQLQELITRMQEDTEFRFSALEGGAPPTPTTGTQTSTDEQLPPSDVPTVIDPLVGDEDLMDPAEMGGDDNLFASDVFGQTAPSGQGGQPAPLGQTLPSSPLDLSLEGGAAASGDGAAQFQAGYDAVVRGDYAFAEAQFRQFVDQYPSSNQAPDATYWLGETLIQRNAYDDAANVLLTGFEAYPTSTRAPDLLFKLGVALHGAGEFDTACRTYTEVLRRYPDASSSFRQDVTNEQARAGC